MTPTNVIGVRLNSSKGQEMNLTSRKISNQDLRDIVAEKWDGSIAHNARKIAAQKELVARTSWLRS